MRRLYVTATAVALVAIAVSADDTLAKVASSAVQEPPKKESSKDVMRQPEIAAKPEGQLAKEVAHGKRADAGERKPREEPREGKRGGQEPREGRRGHRGEQRDGEQEPREGRRGQRGEQRDGEQEPREGRRGQRGEQRDGEQPMERRGQRGEQRDGEQEPREGRRGQRGEQRDGETEHREGRRGQRGEQRDDERPSPFVFTALCAAVGAIVGAAVVTLVRRHRKAYTAVSAKEVPATVEA